MVQGSATRGNLQAELGLTQPELKLKEIINEWSDNIKITPEFITTFGKQLQGKLTIGIVLSSYNDVLGLNSAIQDTEKGDQLEWLKWLLTRGDDREIIMDYRVKTGNFSTASSRTGFGIMVKDTQRSWGVPTEFAGSPGSNFVTRVLNGKNFQDALVLLIKGELVESLRRIT